MRHIGSRVRDLEINAERQVYDHQELTAYISALTEQINILTQALNSLYQLAIEAQGDEGDHGGPLSVRPPEEIDYGFA